MSKDFRGYIDQLDHAGELIHVTREVDPDHNMGVLCWYAQDKAVLFEAIAGYPGWRALGQAPANFRQLALGLGLPETTLVLELARALERPGIKPQAVSSAPCKEVTWTGDQVDLWKIPVHVHSQRDGGRFIAGGIGVVKDPDTGVYNMSYHRMMIKDRTRTGFMMVPRHAWQILQKYEARGEPMPVAVAIGNHPTILLAASLTGTFEMDEMEIAGTLLGSPLPVVACETLDLVVPADSEIVLEGLIPPRVREPEGPFGEFQGYYLTGAKNSPVFEARCVTMRRDPIYMLMQSGYDVEAAIFHRIPMAITQYNRLRDVEGGSVTIHNVNVLPSNFINVIQMTPRFEGQAKNVLLAALSGPYLHPKIAIAVDEDVDPFDPADVFWAVATRVNPERDVMILPGVRNHPMDPAITAYDPAESTHQTLMQSVGSKMLIDATKPPLTSPQRPVFNRIRPMGWGESNPEEWLGTAFRKG